MKAEINFRKNDPFNGGQLSGAKDYPVTQSTKGGLRWATFELALEKWKKIQLSIYNQN